MRNNKKYSTRTLLRYRFFAVAAATIGLSLLPLLLLFISTHLYRTDPTKNISASERLMPQACEVDVSDYITDGGSAMLVDSELFRRVYDNLIENAMKYNQAGTKIMLGVENKNSSVEITAADNGIGIPAEHIDKIFQPFYRADRNASSSSGSGLGLAIVRQIVTLHGGEISYIGDDGGCKWLISLPTTE